MGHRHGCRAKTPAHVVVMSECCDCLDELLIVALRHSHATIVLLQNLARGTYVKRYDRRPASEAFNHASGQPFVTRSYNQKIERSIPIGHIGSKADKSY